MSLDFVAGAVFMAGVFLIGAWLRDRWRYRLGSVRTLPPRPLHDTTGTTDTTELAPTSRPRESSRGLRRRGDVDGR